MANVTFDDDFGSDRNSCFLLNQSDPKRDNHAYDTKTRIYTLIAETVVGNIGCILVIVWLWTNSRRLKSRVNLLILHVTIADLFVIEFTIMSQLVLESLSTKWVAGDFMCRLVKFLQIVGMFSSTSMLLMLAFDRHQAIRRPLKQPIKVWILVLIAWSMAAVGALPQIFLFQTGCLFVVNEDGSVEKQPICTSYLARKGAAPWEKQVYLVYSTIIFFFIPVAFLLVAYLRIFLKICRKERENREQANGEVPLKPGKIRLHATNSASLRKAKTKTLTMTVVIVLVYIVCTVPYAFVEMWKIANSDKPPPSYWMTLMAFAAVLLPTNSVINPYVFLIFNGNFRCFSDFWKRIKGRPVNKDADSHVSTRSDFVSNSTVPRAGHQYSSRENSHKYTMKRVDFVSNGGHSYGSKGAHTDIELKPLRP